ncbi:M1 family aminopeptidase [bacterium]|nr:M1 family aminopeptidase [bacterium]
MTKKSFLPLWLCSAIVVLSGCQPEQVDISPGVSWKLAQHRADYLSNIRYELRLDIPDSLHQKIRGEETLYFDLKKADQPVVLDFVGPRESVITVTKDDHLIPYQVIDEHIVIPRSVFEAGTNTIQIVFWAGEGSLNRNEEYLYTLFVPDRARFAFPCFDQPNLKARFRLVLNTPVGWRAVANAPAVSSMDWESHSKHAFAETELISTYLFSFAAGKFKIETAERAGRVFNMYHRETDRDKIDRNRQSVFDLHHAAITWLEDYTGIAYPFGKFDFVLIPSFQYGGMEHPGAVLYRASSLLLDESVTQNQLLGRASLISHETAHMWFGDLVTMNWFDDVWMKEVFANFMAAKIVNPSFPEVDHDLRFLLAHYPAAYAVDRTAGANPIRQQLDNLNEAGTLYGAIIYRKAPIVMKHLEGLMGVENFRDGLRDYLQTFQFGNATWHDLISILNERTEKDLTRWSQVWVEEPGRPAVSIERSLDSDGKLGSLRLQQSSPLGDDVVWPQTLNLLLGYSDSLRYLRVDLNSSAIEVPEAVGLDAPDFLVSNGKGLGYGLFELDSASLEFLQENLWKLDDARLRGLVWLSLWDAMLEQRLEPRALIDLIAKALPRERDELNIQRVLGYLESAYWRFLGPSERQVTARPIEDLLWRLMEQAPFSRLRAAYFNTYRDVILSRQGMEKLTGVWQKRLKITGLELSQRDFTAMALELAVRGVPNWRAILETQLNRISNPDRKARFAFVMPALSDQSNDRDVFFESLKYPKNREHEPWVLQALSYLHHPLRTTEAEKYILPSLELLEEIQRTGDIFFPKRWLDSTLGGHQSREAADMVRGFLSSRPDLPAKLRGKVLQSADGLFRAAEIVDD